MATPRKQKAAKKVAAAKPGLPPALKTRTAKPRKPQVAKVIALPQRAEPLVAAPSGLEQPGQQASRAVALYRPPGLISKVAQWLTGRTAAARAVLAAKPVGQADELIRLRVENHRLRERIKLLEARAQAFPRGAPKRMLQPQP